MPITINKAVNRGWDTVGKFERLAHLTTCKALELFAFNIHSRRLPFRVLSRYVFARSHRVAFMVNS